MATTVTLLQLAQNAGLSASETGAVEAMLTTDELTPLLPFETIAGTTAYRYDRKLADVTAAWVASQGAFTAAGGVKYGRILAETKKLYAQPDVSPEDAARLGGVNGVLGSLAASAFVAMSRAIANKAINGSSAPTSTIDAQSYLVTTSGGITACTTGGLHDLSQSTRGELKYTASGTLFRYKAPGDTDFGDAVSIGTTATGTVFSKNGENYLTITRGAGSLASNTTAVVTIANGADEPDGLYKLMAGVTRQWLYGGDNGGPVSFDLLDQLVDTCKGSGQKVMVTNKAVRRAVRKLFRDKASAETFTDVGSRKVLSYDGIPIIASDYMLATRTRGTASGVCSAIICASLGTMQGFRGVASTGIVDAAMQGARLITSGPFGMQCHQLPVSQSNDNVVARAVGYVGFAQELVEGVAILDGLTTS